MKDFNKFYSDPQYLAPNYTERIEQKTRLLVKLKELGIYVAGRLSMHKAKWEGVQTVYCVDMTDGSLAEYDQPKPARIRSSSQTECFTYVKNAIVHTFTIPIVHIGYFLCFDKEIAKHLSRAVKRFDGTFFIDDSSSYVTELQTYVVKYFDKLSRKKNNDAISSGHR